MKRNRKKFDILLVCGAGASSSFMAAKMRVAARKRDLDITITARSESELSNFAGEIDVIMLGPHLSTYYESLKERYQEEACVILMKGSYYSSLDGDSALDHLLEELDQYDSEHLNGDE